MVILKHIRLRLAFIWKPNKNFTAFKSDEIKNVMETLLGTTSYYDGSLVRTKIPPPPSNDEKCMREDQNLTNENISIRNEKMLLEKENEQLQESLKYSEKQYFEIKQQQTIIETLENEADFWFNLVKEYKKQAELKQNKKTKKYIVSQAKLFL